MSSPHTAVRAQQPAITAWLALVAVCLLQVTAAIHESHHVLADVAETCDICVQLDTGDDFVAAASGFVNTDFRTIKSAQHGTHWHPGIAPTAYYSRAPPSA